MKLIIFFLKFIQRSISCLKDSFLKIVNIYIGHEWANQEQSDLNYRMLSFVSIYVSITCLLFKILKSNFNIFLHEVWCAKHSYNDGWPAGRVGKVSFAEHDPVKRLGKLQVDNHARLLTFNIQTWKKQCALACVLAHWSELGTCGYFSFLYCEKCLPISIKLIQLEIGYFNKPDPEITYICSKIGLKKMGELHFRTLEFRLIFAFFCL